MDDYFNYIPFHCFDIPLKQQFSSEKFDPNNVSKLLKPEDDLLKSSIGKIFPSGSCFVFCKPKGIIHIGNKRVIAFGLTNFHVVYNLITKEKNQQMFVSFDFDMNFPDKINAKNIVTTFFCSPILEFQSKLNSVQISNHSKTYCLPNDIALLAIYQFSPFLRPSVPDLNLCLDLTVLPIADKGEVRNYELKNVIISGYPTRNRDIYCLLPSFYNIIDLEMKIRDGFHNFNSQVISEGSLRLSETGLAELELSSTTGMSGSPIMTGSSSESKVLGIYCGGPPLSGQAELIQMVRSLFNKDYEKTYQLLLSLPFEDRSCYSLIDGFDTLKMGVLQVLYLAGPEEIKDSIDRNYPEIKNLVIENEFSEESVNYQINLVCSSVESFLRTIVGKYKENEIFFYNSGISAECEVFDYIRDLKSLLETLNLDFDSEENLEDFLLNHLNLA